MKKLCVMALALVFGIGLAACDKICPKDEKAEEALKAETAKAEDAGKKAADLEGKLKAAEAAAKKGADDAKAASDALKAAQDAAKKAEEEKGKLEADKKACDEEKKKLEEEKAQVAMQARREAIGKDLAQANKEIQELNLKMGLSLNAWKSQKDDAKAAEVEAVMNELKQLQEKVSSVEGLVAQGNFDGASVTLEAVKTTLPALQQKAAPLVNEKPIDPAQWEKMLNILAAETCLTKKNLPAQDFEKEREALFGKQGLDRPTYEGLRALFNQKNAPEDQAKLGEMVGKLCPELMNQPAPEAAVPEAGAQPAPAEGTKEPAGEVKKEAALSATFEGTLNGVKGKVKLTVKEGKLGHSVVVVEGAQFVVKGAFGKTFNVNGKKGEDFVKCSGTVEGDKLEGKCDGTYNKKRFDATFTAKKK